jgi:RimJ/RimL family protein N-acetyltransferase
VNPPPTRIETERLLLRPYGASDAVAFAELLERSRAHLAAFIPFFLDGDPRERVVKYADDFAAGVSFSYAAVLDERLIGGGGLFPRIGPGALEVGYHVHADEVRRGFATEIAAALVDVGFETCGAERLEMHIDPGNAASLGVARKLGFAETGYDAKDSCLIFSRVRPASESSTTSA